jgi:vacuolar-type H+-ATPase subunit I/STV1
MTAEEIFKLVMGSAGALGVLILALKWLDSDRTKVVTANAALQGKLEAEHQARIVQLEKQNEICNADRMQLHTQIHQQRVSFDEKLENLRRTHDEKISELNKRIVHIYESRHAKNVADRMEKAADKLGVVVSDIPPNGDKS